MDRDLRKHWEFLAGLIQAKWAYSLNPCQKNERSVKSIQKAVMVGNRNTYGALSLKRITLQNEIDE
jgi:hypothetical protein